jgi:hypothetical protein
MKKRPPDEKIFDNYPNAPRPLNPLAAFLSVGLHFSTRGGVGFSGSKNNLH